MLLPSFLCAERPLFLLWIPSSTQVGMIAVPRRMLGIIVCVALHCDPAEVKGISTPWIKEMLVSETHSVAASFCWIVALLRL